LVECWIAVDPKRQLGGAVRGGARFRPRALGFESEDIWPWQGNPFAGTQPFNGLLALMMLLNSTDLKADNNHAAAAPGRRCR
jgi:hypothetical protein